MPRDQVCGLLCSNFPDFFLVATSYSWLQLNNGLEKSGMSDAFCLMVAFPYICHMHLPCGLLDTINSPASPLRTSLGWRKACFCKGLQGIPGNRGIPGLVATGSWEPFLWLHFRLRKIKDLQGFSMVPRADPTRRQVSLKTPTGHRWQPTLQKHLFSNVFKGLRETVEIPVYPSHAPGEDFVGFTCFPLFLHFSIVRIPAVTDRPICCTCGHQRKVFPCYITWFAVRPVDICRSNRGVGFFLPERGADTVGDKSLYQTLHITQRQAP